jgi:N-dimethylarginine dimethylaminohydrolase
MKAAVTKTLLMVDPTHYRVEYAINPFMLDENGKLKKVDSKAAREQWSALVSLFKKIGLEVHTLIGPPELPDMVYPANCCFPFINTKTAQKTVLMGRMRSKFRQPELALFEDWFKKHDYQIERLQDPKICFEGNGDALLHPALASTKKIVWGGFGPRTDKTAYSELIERFNFEVLLLELVRPEFYHLDTCFSILDEKTVAIQPTAFNKDGLSKIRTHFRNVIEISEEEALKFMAANCYCPNGKDVIVQKGALGFVKALKEKGFQVHEIETGEFIKGGGSVFCLKMAL